MKVLCHYNSGFCIIPRVLHVQTNQLQKYQYCKIHFSVFTLQEQQHAGQGMVGGHGRQEQNLIITSSTKQSLTLGLCYKERGSTTSLFDHT